jgi:uncharacterized protein (TIGR02466 family)
MIIQNLFPTAVGSTSLPRDFTQAELDFFDFQKNNVRFNKTNRTSIDNYVLENEALTGLKEFCNAEVNKYFQEIYQPSTDVSLYITQSWINFTGRNEGHHQHYHGNSFISGCLYLDVDKEADTDKITFYRTSSQLVVETANYNPYNSTSWWIGVEKKGLLLFPSNLTHAVEANKSDTLRVSLSFNTFFKGTVGSQKDLTELKI